ncbi:MAG: DUF1833 family protein [Pseudomonadota bacterium]
MTISTPAREHLFAQESDEVFLVLLTIDHEVLATPIRVVNNLEEVTSRGEDFIAFPFDITLPDSHEGATPAARLTIDNVSREIGEAVRQMTSPPTVLIEIIMASAPDTVEASFPGFLMRNIKTDATKVTGELVVEDLTREPYPAVSFTPGRFPGVF